MKLKRRQLDNIEEGIKEFRIANELMAIAEEKEATYNSTSFLLKHGDKKTIEKIQKEHDNKPLEKIKFDLEIAYSSAKGNYARAIDRMVKALNKCYLFTDDENLEGHNTMHLASPLIELAVPVFTDLKTISDVLYQLMTVKVKRIISHSIISGDYRGYTDLVDEELNTLSNIAKALSNYCLSHHMSYPDEFIEYMQSLPEPKKEEKETVSNE